MAGVGELVNILQNTQRKKPYSSSRSNPAKVKQPQSIGEKGLMMSVDPDSNPPTINNQKTDLGRSLPS